MDASLTDERLCWLAVRDRLDRRARGRGLVALIRVLTASPSGGRRIRGNDANEAVAERMMDYAVAVDELACRLDTQERWVLRTTGKVPSWFVTRVEEYVAEHRGGR